MHGLRGDGDEDHTEQCGSVVSYDLSRESTPSKGLEGFAFALPCVCSLMAQQPNTGCLLGHPGPAMRIRWACWGNTLFELVVSGGSYDPNQDASRMLCAQV